MIATLPDDRDTATLTDEKGDEGDALRAIPERDKPLDANWKSLGDLALDVMARLSGNDP